MEPALRRGDRDDGVGGGVWRIVLRAQSYARSALTLRAELSKMLCVLCELLCAVVVTHASKRSPAVKEALITTSDAYIFLRRHRLACVLPRAACASVLQDASWTGTRFGRYGII